MALGLFDRYQHERPWGLPDQLSPLAETWTQSEAACYYEGLQQEWNIAAEGLFGPDGVLGQIAHPVAVALALCLSLAPLTKAGQCKLAVGAFGVFQDLAQLGGRL